MAFRFETLEIWKEAIGFTKEIYQVTEKFPQSELYGLTSQLRRASVSISSNIAEGSASESLREFKNFLNYAIRSMAEVISELSVAKTLAYLGDDDYNHLYQSGESLIKRISRFRNSLK